MMEIKNPTWDHFRQLNKGDRVRITLYNKGNHSGNQVFDGVITRKTRCGFFIDVKGYSFYYYFGDVRVICRLEKD